MNDGKLPEPKVWASLLWLELRFCYQSNSSKHWKSFLWSFWKVQAL